MTEKKPEKKECLAVVLRDLLKENKEIKEKLERIEKKIKHLESYLDDGK